MRRKRAVDIPSIYMFAEVTATSSNISVRCAASRFGWFLDTDACGWLP
eukprot:COSAG01_NODE_60588_length_294_cov_0.523077_1_plen_47_part_10